MAVDDFMNNEMVTFWSQHDDIDIKKTYQEYAIVSSSCYPISRQLLIGSQQDYFYLIDYIKFKAFRLTTIPVSDVPTLTSEAQSVASSTGDVSSWKDTCIKTLQIPADRLEKTDRSVAELAYANYLQNNASISDWFNLHVIMIACVYVSI